jgi:hypothetical protein
MAALRKRHLLPATAAVLVAAAAVLAPRSFEGPEPPPNDPPPALARLAPATKAGTALPQPAGAAPLAYRFIPGEQSSFDLSYESRSAADFSRLLEQPAQGSAGLSPSFETTVKGRLEVSVIDASHDAALVALRLRGAEVWLASGGVDAVAEAAAVRAGLETESLVRLSPRGTVLGLRFDPAAGDLAQGYARSLLALLQVTLPEAGASGGSWEAEEDDPNGRFLVAYREITGGDALPGRTFEKRRVRFLGRPPQEAGLAGAEIAVVVEPAGSAAVRFDPAAGGLLSLAGSEHDVLSISGRTVGWSETTFQLRLLARGAVPAGELRELRLRAEALARRSPETSLSARPSPAAEEEALERAELGQWTAESLLAEVEKAEAGAGGAMDETALYLKLKALAYLEPQACPALGFRLAAAPAGGPAFRLLSGALGEAGHPEAVAALASAVRSRRGDEAALLALLPLLGSVRSPTPRAEETIREIAFGTAAPEVVSTARFALGALARSLAATSPERAGRIVDQAVGELKGASSPAERRQWLLVLGNAASPRSLPAIASCAADAAPEVRAAVAAAVAPFEGRRADQLIGRLLSADRDPAVRLEAALAFGWRTLSPQTFAAQKAAFASEKETSVRLVLLENLWRGRDRFPEAADLVRRAAASDASSDVRKAAAKLLAGSG